MIACAPWEWISWALAVAVFLFIGSAAVAVFLFIGSAAYAGARKSAREGDERTLATWRKHVEAETAERVSRMCDWSNPAIETPGSHRAFHFGYLCPYEVVVPALLRGEPDPRRHAPGGG